MKISEFIERLEELRVVAGEDVEVAIPVPIQLTDDYYDGAMAELQNVISESSTDSVWRSKDKDNTHQIIVVR